MDFIQTGQGRIHSFEIIHRSGAYLKTNDALDFSFQKPIKVAVAMSGILRYDELPSQVLPKDCRQKCRLDDEATSLEYVHNTSTTNEARAAMKDRRRRKPGRSRMCAVMLRKYRFMTSLS